MPNESTCPAPSCAFVVLSEIEAPGIPHRAPSEISEFISLGSDP